MRISVWSADVCSCDLPENQLSYAFPLLRSAEKVRNDWKNFFVDRRPAIAATADDEMLRYVRRDNYRDARGRIELTQRLQRVPKRWDVNGNGKWDGYRPDAAFNFDAEGFAHAPAGSSEERHEGKT